jgi:hypothetical protein
LAFIALAKDTTSRTSREPLMSNALTAPDDIQQLQI